MISRQSFRVSFGTLATVSVILALFFVPGRPAEKASSVLSLSPPGFLELARASGDTSASAIASVLDSEAGIAAWGQTSPFALATIKPLFHTIEQETADYLLGTIEVPNNWDNFDVHVYAHKAGWILTYYLRIQPAVTVFDWQNFTGSPGPPTRFQAVTNLITDMLGRSELSLTYYDFRYPNATNLMIALQYVVDDGTECFTIQDTSWLYYERTWLHAGYNGNSHVYGTAVTWYRLDDVEISRVSANDVTVYRYGYFDGTQLPASSPHTVCVYGASYYHNQEIIGALSLVYGPQP